MRSVLETDCHRLVQKLRDAYAFGAVTRVYWHEVSTHHERGGGDSRLQGWHYVRRKRRVKAPLA